MKNVFNVFKFKEDAENLSTQLKNISVMREQTTRDRETIAGLPLSKDCMYAQACKYIDKRAEIGRTGLKDAFKVSMSCFQEHTPFILQSFGAYAEELRINPDMLYLLFGDAMKESLRKEFERLSWPDKTGPSLADRATTIASLDKKIADLELEYDTLRSHADSAGLNVDRLAPPLGRKKRTTPAN